MIALSTVLGVVVAQNVFFYIIAAVMVVAALRVVTTNNVLHAALYLVVVLAGVAAQFILLGAEFVGVTQVLVYIGAVIVLFLFGIMLTRSQVGAEDNLDHDNVLWPVLTAVLLFAVLGFAVVDFGSLSEAPTSIDGTVFVDQPTAKEILGEEAFSEDAPVVTSIAVGPLESFEAEVLDSASNDDARAELAEQLDENVDVVVHNTDFGRTAGIGVAGAQVQLLSSDGELIESTETGSDGDFSFADLPSDTYTVERLRGSDETGSTATAYLTDAKIINVLENNPTTVEQVSDSIFGQYIVAFEAISVLLLAALIGAIVVARKE